MILLEVGDMLDCDKSGSLNSQYNIYILISLLLSSSRFKSNFDIIIDWAQYRVQLLRAMLHILMKKLFCFH